MTSSIDYADKIAKLLRKAESTDSPAEAEVLRERAYELMVKYAVTDAELAARADQDGTAQQEEIIKMTVPLFGIYRDALVTLVHRATMSFKTMTGYVTKNTYPWLYDGQVENRGKGHVYFIVGFKSDVERMHLLATSLLMQAISGLNQWWKNDENARYLREYRTKMEQYKDRREFVLNFADGVGEKISTTLVKVTSAAGPGTELILRDRGQLAKEWLASTEVDLKKNKSRLTTGSSLAGDAGYRAGLRAAVGQTELTH